MNILICGGGNAAHALAGLLSTQEDLRVRVYLSFEDEARQWKEGLAEQKSLHVHLPQGELVGRPVQVSSQAAEIVPGADLVLLALPAFAHEVVLRQMTPHLQPAAWVGALPARGCFDLCALQTLGEKAPAVNIFGLQTLPWACRIERYGRSVRVLGTKAKVDLASWPAELAPQIAATLSPLLGVNLQPVSSLLSLTLAGTGQLIHPGIMYGLFHNWDGQPYAQAPLFYQGIDPYTAGILQSMSDEVQELRHNLEARFSWLDLTAVRNLYDWLRFSYTSDIADDTTLQSAFTSNRSYAGLQAPMRSVDGGLVPDFHARYISEDVPYALIATRGIAELAGVPTPQIDQVIRWAQGCLGQEFLVSGVLRGQDLGASRAPQRYGYQSINSLVESTRMPV